MDILQATQQYEAWLSHQIALIPADLDLKHSHMAEDEFSFLRATFYRWMQVWHEVCPDLERAPLVLGVGDLHVENFGTWQDIEGRLVWGINDFDEACQIPYTLDLVRLATSVRLAISSEKMAIEFKEACNSLMTGYQEGLESGGIPFILAERHCWLRDAAISSLRDPVHFWEKIDALPSFHGEVGESALKALAKAMPEPDLPFRIVHRIAGLGSLGRLRYLAIAEWRGGKLAREAKALAPSACQWARGETDSVNIQYEEILNQAVRSADPTVQVKGNWIVRRLAPYCSRIELGSLEKQRDECRLLKAMGFEAANIHLGSKEARKEIQRDLKSRPNDWLFVAARRMEIVLNKDWQEWRKANKR